ncbi:HlyD family secretion protein [Acidocella sp.]|uniref:HlyD family secretion protein n=1 Tax=Acidocella sp. TaxID=50710 RepID=UPI002F40C988
MATPNGPPRKWRAPKIPGVVWRALSFVLAAVVLIVCYTQWNRWEGEARYQTTDDAYLQTNLTPLSAQVAGYVRAVPVQDYAQVQAGQLIVQIVDDNYRATLAQAVANVASAKAKIAGVEAQHPLLEANLRAAQAVVASTTATLAQNGRDVARQQRLLSTGSSSVEELERVQTTRAQLTAQLAQNRAQADAVARQIDLLASQLDQAIAALAAAQAAMRLAAINLGYTQIVAPTDGFIGLRQVLPGQYLAPGTQVTTLAELPLIWVLANYKEVQLTRVRIGQPASITVDTFPGHTLHGHVIAISPASGAQFALLPPDNATGNFTKIVQRIAVKISIDDPDGLGGRLRSGMSAIPTIDTANYRQRP